MKDYIRRILVVVFLAACIGMLFIGGRTTNAEMNTNTIEESWSWPITGIITDTFGTRNGKHKGLDIAAPMGKKIYTVEDGIVKRSYYSTSSYGNVIFIEHPNGYETVYAHLSKRLVKEGDKIKKGQIIGEIGSTGRSTGPHLHFEIHNGEWNPSRDNAVNPLSVLKDEQKLVITEIEENKKRLVSNLTKGPITTSEETIETSSIHKDTYVVKSGDNLTFISQKVGKSVKEIMELNHLQSDLIFPDQVLVLEKS